MKHFAGAQVFEGLSPRRAEIFLPKALNPEALRFCALNFHIALLNALSELRTRKGSVQMTHVFILYSLWVFIDFYGSVVLKAFLKNAYFAARQQPTPASVEGVAASKTTWMQGLVMVCI